MPKDFRHDQLVEQLRERTRESTMTAVANAAGVSVVYISEILSGKRPLGPKVSEYLGYTRETVFRKRAA